MLLSMTGAVSVLGALSVLPGRDMINPCCCLAVAVAVAVCV